MSAIKKDFQKLIKTIRSEIGEGRDYPKAMMTGQQQTKNTATINCAGMAFAEKATQAIMEDERFQAFLTRYDATAVVEETSGWDGRPTKQIRLHYPDQELEQSPPGMEMK